MTAEHTGIPDRSQGALLCRAVEPIVVEIVRGDMVEAVHRVHAVAVSGGSIVEARGHATLVTYFRSSAKPIQALPVVRARTDLANDEIAIACASHHHRPEQLAPVRSLLATVSGQFDWVIVDGPPVLEAPEAVDLAPLVDGAVIVVRSGHTKRPVALRAADLLRKSGVRILGSVLNRRRLEIPDFIYRRI